MRALRISFLTLALSTVALAANGTLPRTTAVDVRNAIEKADAALENGERQLALALYKGSLYPEAVKVALDERTLDDFGQKRAVLTAVETWDHELDGDFPVTLVDRVEDADVVIKFVDSIPQKGADALGLIQLEKSFKWSRNAHYVHYKGTISIVRRAPGGKLSEAETCDVAMHELGHLLGLADTSDTGVLMGPLERGKPHLKPTKSEIQDVRALRRTLRERIRAAEALN